MSFNFEITEGLEKRAIKLGLYGSEGIGKTTVASQCPNALIVDTENGTSRIDCRRVKCASWDTLISIIKGVKENPTICKTLVIDTLDKAESYCVDYICQKFHKANIEDWGYGKGYTVLQDEMNRFFELLNTLIDVDINVCIVAHGKPRKFELPEEEGAFDRWELKLTKQVAPLFKEWCDVLLFCNYKTYVVTTENNVKKAQGGKRVMYTTHHACWDAKNRFNLPDELELSYKSIAHLFETSKKETKTSEVKPNKSESELVVKLNRLIEESGVTSKDVEQVVSSRGYYASGTKISDYKDEFITRWIFPNWKKIVDVINKNKEIKGDK